MHTLGHLVTKFMINYSIKLLNFLIEIKSFHKKLQKVLNVFSIVFIKIKILEYLFFVYFLLYTLIFFIKDKMFSLLKNCFNIS